MRRENTRTWLDRFACARLARKVRLWESATLRAISSKCVDTLEVERLWKTTPSRRDSAILHTWGAISTSRFLHSIVFKKVWLIPFKFNIRLFRLFRANFARHFIWSRLGYCFRLFALWNNWCNRDNTNIEFLVISVENTLINKRIKNWKRGSFFQDE